MRLLITSGIGAAILLGLLQPTRVNAQAYSVRPKCDCSETGKCIPKAGTWGYNDTLWRQFPQPRPDQRFQSSVGAERIPTPPGEITKPLPRAPIVPNKPEIESGLHPDSVLPSPKDSSTETAPLKSQPDLGPGASLKASGSEKGSGVSPNLEKGGPMALPGIGGFDQPDLPFGDKPKTDNPVESKAPAPSTSSPVFQVPAPSPGVDNTRDVLKPSGSDTQPKSPAALPSIDAPALPKIDRQSYLEPEKGQRVPRSAELVMHADWTSALAPESLLAQAEGTGTSVQPQTPPNAPPTGESCPFALEGYCPVELNNHDRWVAGSSKHQVTYEGRAYLCSTREAAAEFRECPAKYAPALGGIDPVIATEENRQVAGSINHSAVWSGRLYLFSSSESLANFQADPARYARRSAGSKD